MIHKAGNVKKRIYIREGYFFSIIRNKKTER